MGHSIPTPCGARGNCGKCKVKVVEGYLKISSMDRIQLTDKELEDAVKIEIPES